MVYFVFESAIISIVANLGWRYILYPRTGIEISYFEWVVGIWIFKAIFFDVFKLISSLPMPVEEETEEN